jgi:hypothetical protein
MTYEHIKDIDRFFIYDAKEKIMVFNSEKLVVSVPTRYGSYNLLDISETVTTIAVMDLVIDDKYQASLTMLAKIEMEYSDTSRKMVDGVEYHVFTLYKGDKFMCNTELVKDSSTVFAIYSEMITKGHPIYTLNYENISHLFDKTKQISGVNLNKVDHVIFEIIYSHIARLKDNLSVQYRHTEMTEPYKFIGLRNIAYSTTSSNARILGSYFDSGLNSSLLTDVTTISPLEQLLRTILLIFIPMNLLISSLI